MEEESTLNLGSKTANKKTVDNIVNIAKGKIEEEKPSIFKTIREGLFSGDPKKAILHVYQNILEPEIRSLMFKMVTGFFSVLIFDTSFNGKTIDESSLDDYTKFFTGGKKKKKKKETSDVNELCKSVVFETHDEAEAVLNHLKSRITTYGTVSVYTFLDNSQIPCDYTKQNWGWVDLKGAYIYQGPGGWAIELPEPRPLRIVE